LQRIFSFQSLYAGVAPHRALALYAVISYLDTVAGVHFPRGGMHAVPVALAAAAAKHGVSMRYDTTVTRVETYAGRARAVHTTTGERIPADVVVLNPDLPVAYQRLLPAERPPSRLSRLRYSPSCVVVHVGSTRTYSRTAHHNLHFGRGLDVHFRRCHPARPADARAVPARHQPHPDRSRTGAGRPAVVLRPRAGAPPEGRRTFREHLARSRLGDRYADQLMSTLELRGYVDFRSGIEVRRVVTPADWEATGHAAGTPFAAAHTFGQTGPFRPGNLHPTLSNVVFVGSGTQPGVGVPMVLISGQLAARRVTG
jgi:phytoene desaturase